VQARRRTDHHPKNFTDGTTGEAMRGGLSRHRPPHRRPTRSAGGMVSRVFGGVRGVAMIHLVLLGNRSPTTRQPDYTPMGYLRGPGRDVAAEPPGRLAIARGRSSPPSSECRVGIDHERDDQFVKRWR
jgi:hypothetical protein